MENKSITNIIIDINQEIHNSGDYEKFNLLEYSTNGYGELISFFGVQLWSSEDEGDRGYNEKSDEPEPLDDFLRRKINEFISRISWIKLTEETKNE